MEADDKVVLNGVITETCRGGMFKVSVKFGAETKVFMAYPSGKIRKNGINIVVGDSVAIEASPYSLDKARIVYRNK